jgi:zinc transport system substrate-binding protein
MIRKRWHDVVIKRIYKINNYCLLVCFFFMISLIIFSFVQNSSASEPLKVYVVNYPLKYFAERIGGENVQVVFPAPEDVDPAYWTPDIATIGAYQQADLILLNGAGYAGWIDKVSLSRSKLVNTSKNLQDRIITIKGAVTHSHGTGGAHAHEGAAFTTWLDFDLATLQARAITKAFIRRKPDLRKVFDSNFAALEKDLAALSRDIEAAVSKDPSKPLVASHPVYDYFTRRYGLNIQSVHWEPDEFPDDRQWVELNGILKAHPAKWMIWEGKPGPIPVKKLKAIGIESLVFDPCANTPGQGDFLSVMHRNVENLKSAFESS